LPGIRPAGAKGGGRDEKFMDYDGDRGANVACRSGCASTARTFRNFDRNFERKFELSYK